LSSKQKAQRELGFLFLKKPIVVNYLRTRANVMNKKYKIPEIIMTLKYSEKVNRSELFKIKSSEDAHEAFKAVFNADRLDWIEEAFLLCLNRNGQVIGSFKMSQGGIAGTIIDPKILFGIALKCQASSVILAHNHPSGNLEPSVADRELTKKLVAAGKLLDISVLDHLILTSEGYYSHSDRGNL
jgi:DNA repair protein RadC